MLNQRVIETDLSVEFQIYVLFVSVRRVGLRYDDVSLKKWRPEFDFFFQTFENSFTVMDDGRWMCRLCCGFLRDKAKAKRHLLTVHLKEKKHACAFCGKRFGQASHVKGHEKTCAQRPL